MRKLLSSWNWATLMRTACATLLLAALAAQNAWAVGSDKVKFMGGTVASVPEKTEGRVDVTDPSNMVFKGDKGGTVQVPWQTVQAIEYGQRVSRRWKTALFLTPWAVFSKGRKHMVTITYEDAAGTEQAAVFEFGKDVYRTALAALKAKSGKEIACQDEDARKQFGGGCAVMAPEPEEKKK
jgi:hypothetical protein